MEEMKSCAASICAASAVICIIENIVSGTKLNNQMKILLDLILAIVIITPFIRKDITFDLRAAESYSAGNYDEAAEIYNERLRQQTSYNISEVLLSQIRSAGVICNKIETEVNISEDGSISITKVALIADDFERAADIVRSSLGKDAEVVNYAG
ncbi:MAG: hypothetical protein GXY08_09345 [Ruminococcus sp.]|nr:hypothetical protein [Ruminococcus sp.]